MLTKWRICDNNIRERSRQLCLPNSPAIPLPTGLAGTNFSLPAGSTYPVKPMIPNGFRARRAISRRKKPIFPCRQGNRTENLPSRFLDVPAELVAHRRQHPVREVRLAARAEALIERRRQDMRRYRLVDRGLDRPAPFTRIRDAPCETRKDRVFGESARGQIQKPGGDHTAAPPELR